MCFSGGFKFSQGKKNVFPAPISFPIRLPNVWEEGGKTWNGKNSDGHAGCFLRNLNTNPRLATLNLAHYDFTFFDSGARWDAPDAHATHMIDLNRFLQNPFDAADISLAELLSFSSDHLARMIANNPGGELTARITATTSSLTLVQNCATDDLTKKAIRKARKQVKDAFRESLRKEIAKVHGACVAEYGPDGAEVAECFPQGRTIFSACADDSLEQHIEALKNGVTAHQAQLGAPLVAEVTTLRTEWKAVYAQSESSGGAATTSQEGKKMARENLQLMLFLNLLKLAEMVPRQPEKLNLYMQQSLLEDSSPPDGGVTPPPPPVPPTP